MAEPFLGQITLLGCNFPPYGWMFCQGQILSIQQYSALFSLLGTYYGGNGTSNFGLPDLRGRVPNGMGQGPGLQDYVIGETGGVENVSLTQSTVPTHTHILNAYSNTATTTVPAAALPARGATSSGHGGTKSMLIYNTAAPAVSLAPAQVSSVTGGGVAHNNLQPLLALNWCIAIQGTFPTRP
jgi:microcystin-dependent protein